MNVNGFRRMALSMPFAVEAEHMDHPDFRVEGKIFATLPPASFSSRVRGARPTARSGRSALPRSTRSGRGRGDGPLGMVKLTPEQQGLFMEANPGVFVPCQGAWGRRGCTYVRLSEVDRATLRRAMVAAWRNTAPKQVLADVDTSKR